MATREGSCAERIGDQLASRLDWFADIATREQSNDSDVAEEATDEHYEAPLSVEVRRVIRVDLSTGGPGDWFEVEFGRENDVGRIEYHFNDWFDHASVTLEGDEYAKALDFLWAFIENAHV